ncbi:hypothetical protein [Enterococcus casseliflavus]|jgi:hypothetical protein|uniref:DUF4352 domain-containing protein n=1 Tax=Enterococcus casseliflavus TaxID=37734 RepID=A0ABD6YYA9_ENTCA|nr:hypothetical protein [Enterococcus casseliflavus]QGN29149.1 hypothetical protein GFU50_06385 [Enterococcus casseliflavus]DAR28404.1 MAG TPA: hypothetical protein [Caudoviricetes sp.]
MDFLDWLSIVSFLLGTYLSISKILESYPKINMEVFDSYEIEDFIYLKVFIHNKSSNPLVISQTTLSKKNQEMILRSTSYEHTIIDFIDGRKLKSSGLPINLPAKTAESLFLAFPNRDTTEDLFDEKLDFSIKVNNRFYTIDFDLVTTYSPESQLLKES